MLDVGSGKGYLSQHLALCHGLTVVGVDSQLGNTASARKRNRKVGVLYESHRLIVGKEWNGLAVNIN